MYDVFLYNNHQYVFIKSVFDSVISVDQFANITIFKNKEMINLPFIKDHDLDDEISFIKRGELDKQISYFEQLLLDQFSKQIEDQLKAIKLNAKGDENYGTDSSTQDL